MTPCIWCGEPESDEGECPSRCARDDEPQDESQRSDDRYWNAIDRAVDIAREDRRGE